MSLDSSRVHGAPLPVLAQPNRGILINLVLGLWGTGARASHDWNIKGRVDVSDPVDENVSTHAFVPSRRSTQQI